MHLLARANKIIDVPYIGKLSNLCFLLLKTNKIIDFSYIDKIWNLCVCLPTQTKSMTFLTLTSSQIYAFAHQGTQKHWFFLHWQALKSMLLLVQANKIIDSSYLGKLSNPCFCLPRQTKSLIFL
jgi:hypothetical protein